MNDFVPRSRIVLNEMSGDTIPREVTQPNPIVSSDPTQDQQPTIPRRSGRVRTQPERYIGLGESVENLPDDDDPYTYKEAMEDVDSRHWQKAMQSEIESMFDNKVWSLVDLPKGIKPIGCKWVYKRKRGVLTSVKEWLAKQFDMKDLGEASFILGIQVIRDRKNRTIALSQASYIDKILSRFSMQDSKKGMLPFRHGIKLSKEQVPKNEHEEQFMSRVPYASAVGSLMYAMLCTRPDICFAVGIVSRFQSKPGPDHWTAVKHIFKYLKRTRDNMLVYSGGDLVPVGYTDSDFQSDSDSRKSTSGAVFTIGGGAVIWRSIKQSCIADSTMEAEYVAACEAAKEAVWLRQFLIDLEVVPSANKQITIYCDNSGAVANSKEPRSHKRGNTLKESIIF
ncbi:hypothetical protein LWI29_035923 [Acer saccharum]|uniref:Reverse transcriptase Ty1/copia-type domain-containing protein n=1 Tax=Acer saccharum TaxID=4024 RepID=A0AA39UMH7_ACESA|nr:hypothetical protein LWI29_035923 [Acer saccharum]